MDTWWLNFFNAKLQCIMSLELSLSAWVCKEVLVN